MNTPFFIARRYLFSKKSRNVINVISGITMAGIALASMAMICTLSVFNGFHDLMDSIYTDFDPDLKIVPSSGKVFSPDSDEIVSALSSPCIGTVAYTMEDQALVRYKDNQQIVIVRGVSDSFRDMYRFDDIVRGSGTVILGDSVCDYGIPGIGVSNALGCGMQPVSPFTLYAPKRGGRVSMSNPASNFNSVSVFSPGVVFQVNQEPYDGSYIIVSLELSRRLFGYGNEVSSVDIRLADGYSVARAKKYLDSVLGDGYMVLDRYAQQSDVYKVVRLEKLISYLFLSFILLIACFNIVGSLVMLMVEKKQDTATLESLGLSMDDVVRVFVYDGLFIAVIGALTGLAAGVVLTLLQQRYGFVPMGTEGGFIVDSYPVRLKPADVFAVLATVATVSLFSVWPVRRIAFGFAGSRSDG